MKKIGVFIILSTIYSLIDMIKATQTCLYCKRQDVNAGFLYSWSYCPAMMINPATDSCIADNWDYINP